MADFLVENNFLMSTATAGGSTTADVYEVQGVFSISASNQLRGSFWVNKNGESYINNLGTASYTIRDVDGTSIGVTETGITADSSGLFIIAPANAFDILDLNHYTVHISATADGTAKTAILPITVGE